MSETGSSYSCGVLFRIQCGKKVDESANDREETKRTRTDNKQIQEPYVRFRY